MSFEAHTEKYVENMALNHHEAHRGKSKRGKKGGFSQQYAGERPQVARDDSSIQFFPPYLDSSQFDSEGSQADRESVVTGNRTSIAAKEPAETKQGAPARRRTVSGRIATGVRHILGVNSATLLEPQASIGQTPREPQASVASHLAYAILEIPADLENVEVLL